MGSTYYLFGGKRKKKHVRGKRRKEKKIRTFPRRSLELSPFMLSQLSNTVYQRIELTSHTGPQSVYMSGALRIIVLRSQGSERNLFLQQIQNIFIFSVILMHVLHHFALTKG